MLEHILMKQHQHATGNQVQRNPEPVCDGVTVSVRDDPQTEVAHGGKVDPHAKLEEQEGNKRHVGAGRFWVSGKDAHHVGDQGGSRCKHQQAAGWDASGRQYLEDGLANQNAHHEAGEDDAERGAGRLQDGRPQEDDGVDHAFKQGFDGSQHEDFLTGGDLPQPFKADLAELDLADAVVLVPVGGDDDAHKDEEGHRDHVGCHWPQTKPLRHNVCGDPSHHGKHAVPHGGFSEGDGDPLLREVVRLQVLIHIPRFKGREEDRGGNTPQHPADDEDSVAARKLQHAGQGVGHCKDDAQVFPPKLVRSDGRPRAKDDRRSETEYIEHGDLILLETIVGVEFVQVRSLQPVSKHGHQVDRKVSSLELEELRVVADSGGITANDVGPGLQQGTHARQDHKRDVSNG